MILLVLVVYIFAIMLGVIVNLDESRALESANPAGNPTLADLLDLLLETRQPLLWRRSRKSSRLPD